MRRIIQFVSHFKIVLDGSLLLLLLQRPGEGAAADIQSLGLRSDVFFRLARCWQLRTNGGQLGRGGVPGVKIAIFYSIFLDWGFVSREHNININN